MIEINKNKISFELVMGGEKQTKNLYELLKKRKYLISHKDLPIYKIHKKFVEKNPYRFWYLISLEESYIGSFYIKYDNSVGINVTLQNKEILISILSFLKDNHYPNKVAASLIPPYFYVNVASDNIELQNLFERLDARALQVSYKI